MRRGPFALAVVVIAALEAAWFGLAAPAGEGLRRLVDLYAWEGLLLALAGAFLVADRPFLAARMLASRKPAPAARPRADRGFGAVTLALGAGLFAAAALLWVLREPA